MRNSFAKSLHMVMKSQPEIFLVYGDIGNHLFDEIKNDFPGRYVNAGVAESNMVTAASGLAHAGLVPVCYTINAFLYLKSLEQIKLDLAYPNRHVILVGTGGGLSYGELGTSHHSLEDYGVLRTIPNLRIFSPGDSLELEMCFKSSLRSVGPSYIRIGKKETEQIANITPDWSEDGLLYKYIGDGSSKLAVVSAGTVGLAVRESISSSASGLAVDAFSAPELSAASASFFVDKLKEYEYILVVEEHYPHGGLFSLLAEAFAGKAKRPRILRHGPSHEFITGRGTQQEIRSTYGLSPEGIAARIREVISN